MAPQAQAQTYSTGRITITGQEGTVNGSWDTGLFTVAFGGYSESIAYGHFSTPASIASAIAARFSGDPEASLPKLCSKGICAKASGPVVTFQVAASANLGPITAGGSTDSFGSDVSAWPGTPVPEIPSITGTVGHTNIHADVAVGMSQGAQPSILQPIAGASVYLFAAGDSSSTVISLFKGKGVLTDQSGNGYITTDANGTYTYLGDSNFTLRCQSGLAPLYLLAVGGAAGAGTPNARSTLALLLDTNCGNATYATSYDMSELTTEVAAAFVNGSTMTFPGYPGPSVISSSSNYGVLSGAFYFAQNTIKQYNQDVANQVKSNLVLRLNSLADVLAPCVLSSGGAECDRVFQPATPPGGIAPSNTWAASLDIQANPYNNVAAIYDDIFATSPYQPTLPVVPANWKLFDPPPILSGLSPQSALPQQTVVLSGSNFGSDVSHITVTLSGTVIPNPALNAPSQTISVVLPPGALSGPLQVVVDNQNSGVLNLGISIPTVLSVSLTPTQSKVGGPVTIQGQVSSPAPGYVPVGTVYCDGSNGIGAANLQVTPSGTISAVLTGLPAGTHNVSCAFTGQVGFQNSLSTAQEVVQPSGQSGPVISAVTRLSPTSIRVSGSGFGATQGTISGLPNTSGIRNWSDGAVDIQTELADGVVTLTTVASQSVSASFSLDGPEIDSFSIASAPAGVGFVIFGQHFGSDMTAVSATLNGKSLKIIQLLSETSLLVGTSTDASSGLVVITIGGTPATSTTTFEIQPAAACVIP